MPRGRPAKPVAERFWSKVDKNGPNGCWNWTGDTNKSGYGEIVRGPRRSDGKLRAHRVSWEIAHGEIPPGRHVLHKCIANRLCVNPAHLYLGGDRENREDCVRQGRQVCGAQHPLSKLSDAAVAEIKRRYSEGSASQRALAKEYGVSEAAIAKAVTGKAWRHVGTGESPSLTEAQEQEIRSWARVKGISQTYLAGRYGVSKRIIKAIVREETAPE